MSIEKLAVQSNANNSAPLVSFVVPCYNVEKYLPRCLNSLVAQNGANFEIICINDGSIDRTQAVLDDFSSRFSVIKVVSQRNQGLAAARNTGIKVAQGEYISFVDGDDFLSPCFLSASVEAMHLYGADMCVCGLQTIGSEYAYKRWLHKEAVPEFKLVPRDKIGDLILTDKLPCSACGKIVRREICTCNPFHDGRFHEDVEIITSYYLQSMQIAWTTAGVYGYYMRRGSITHSSNPTSKQLDDFQIAYCAMEEQVAKSIGCTISALIQHKIVAVCRFHTMRVRSDDKEQYLAAERRMEAEIDCALEKGKVELPEQIRLRYALLRNSPKIYDILFDIYERNVKRV